MIFAGSEQVIYDFQINIGTSAFNSAITFPDARTSYEKLHDVYPVGVKKFTLGDMPTGLDSSQLYYLRKTGSNYKFYLTLENAVAETSHFVFTDAKDFMLVFTKFRRTIGTQSIAESVGDMYCCEVPDLGLNSTVLYDRCTVVFDGTSYTLKRVSLVMGLNSYIYFPGVSFLFRSDPFLKDGLWQGIDLVISYKDLPPPAVYPDYDHMTLTLIIGTASTYNQLGLPHVDGQTQEILEGGSPAFVNEVYLSYPNPSSITAIASTNYPAGGYGYWAVPPVVITSLQGSGATAVANVGSGGRITSFTITNGGSGYMDYSPFPGVDNSIHVSVPFNFERRFEMINPSTGTTTWPTSSFPYSGTLTDTDTVRNLPSVSYAFSGTSVMPPATVVLKDAYFAGTKATMFPTALELPNCVAVATSTITLRGLQTIGGVLLQAGDRVLVMGNNSYPDSSKSNGIYLASAGSWSRSGDVFVDGSYTFVNQGAGGKRRYRLKASAFVIFPIVFGTSPLVFTVYTAANLPITYDNVDLGNITATCYHDAETNTYYSSVMTLNGIPGRINFGTIGGLPAANRAKFLIEQIGIGTNANINLSNDDFNGLSLLTNYGYETVSDPPGVVVPTVPTRFFTGLTQSKPFFDTRLRADGPFSLTPYRIYRDLGTVKTNSIMGLSFSRVGRAVKSLGLPSEIFTIYADNGDSYITTL
jgi:hypothetical protein